MGVEDFFEKYYPNEHKVGSPAVRAAELENRIKSLESEVQSLHQNISQRDVLINGQQQLIAQQQQILQGYMNANPLIWKLLTDLELEQYIVTDYDLLLAGDITTEHDEVTMTWKLVPLPVEAGER